MADVDERPMDPTEGAEPAHDAGHDPVAERNQGADPSRRAVSEAGPDSDDGAPSRDEMSIAFTPGQLAIGGAVVAGLVVVGIRILFGRRRGRD
jgi:hypothetical protein